MATAKKTKIAKAASKPVKKTTAKPAAKSPTKKPVAKKTVTKKVAVKPVAKKIVVKAAPKKTSVKAVVKKPAAKSVVVKKTVAKAPTPKPIAKKTSVKSAVKKPMAKPAVVKKTAAKIPAVKPVAKKISTNKTAAKPAAPVAKPALKIVTSSAKAAPVKAASVKSLPVVNRILPKMSRVNTEVYDDTGVNIEPRKKPVLPAAFLKKQKIRLIELRNSYLSTVEGVTRDSLGPDENGAAASAFGMHQADAGSDAYDRDFALSILAKEQDAIYEINEALKRIELSTYGLCEMSGKLILEERLEALPFTRFTVECQQRIETEQRGGNRWSRPSRSLFGLDDSDGDSDDENEEEETNSNETLDFSAE
jgi:RNA polymerase-binding transcription factor DksA